MSRRALPPFQRDLVFLVAGGLWGTFIVLTNGAWPLMLISSATMLGPGFLRLWLSGPGIAPSPGSQQEGPPGPRPSLPSTSSNAAAGAEP